jgi:predicted CoA-binding protein
MIVATDAELRALLQRSKTIAVVGASPNPARPSNGVFNVLVDDGRFSVTPINPAVKDIGGIAAFPTLAAYVAERGAPDIVDVFRNAAGAPDVAREAIAAGAKAIWFQLGVVNDDAIAAADAAGLDVVVDRCIKIDIARLPQ